MHQPKHKTLKLTTALQFMEDMSARLEMAEQYCADRYYNPAISSLFSAHELLQGLERHTRVDGSSLRQQAYRALAGAARDLFAITARRVSDDYCTERKIQ